MNASVPSRRIVRDFSHVFEALMEAVKTHSLGQTSHALYDVGGEDRRQHRREQIAALSA